MGYMRDHAIVVIGTYGDHIDRAHTEASRIFPWVSPVSPKALNGSQSFFVPPDGSKEGWPESDEGDSRRGEFGRWLADQRYEDGSSPLKWIEVRVSDDEGELTIENSHEHHRERKPIQTPRWVWIGKRKADKAWPSHGLTGTIRHINHFWFRWEIKQYGDVVRSGSVQGRSEVVAEANRQAEAQMARLKMHAGVYANLSGRS